MYIRVRHERSLWLSHVFVTIGFVFIPPRRQKYINPWSTYSIFIIKYILFWVRTVYGQFGRCAFSHGYDILGHAQVFASVALSDVRNHEIPAIYDSHPTNKRYIYEMRTETYLAIFHEVEGEKMKLFVTKPREASPHIPTS